MSSGNDLCAHGLATRDCQLCEWQLAASGPPESISQFDLATISTPELVRAAISRFENAVFAGCDIHSDQTETRHHDYVGSYIACRGLIAMLETQVNSASEIIETEYENGDVDNGGPDDQP